MKKRVWKIMGMGYLMLALFAAGCSTIRDRDESSAVEKTGAELWANNCARCHNFRSPASLSDAEWDMTVHHMRIRGNLTAEEHEKILKFLKASN